MSEGFGNQYENHPAHAAMETRTNHRPLNRPVLDYHILPLRLPFIRHSVLYTFRQLIPHNTTVRSLASAYVCIFVCLINYTRSGRLRSPEVVF